MKRCLTLFKVVSPAQDILLKYPDCILDGLFIALNPVRAILPSCVWEGSCRLLPFRLPNSMLTGTEQHQNKW
jgi:hypothetical protein